MQILDFLLKNWFILVLLYILFNSLVKRFRPPGGGPAQRTKPSKGMPPFGGGGDPGWPGGRTDGPRQTTVTKAAPAPGPAKSQPARADAPMRHARPATEAEKTAPPSPDASPARRDTPAAKRRLPVPEAPAAGAGEAPAGIGPLTAQDAARGIIWAEILGPPRAKRPYRR